MQTRLELDKHPEDETFGWVLGLSAAYSEVVINFRAATAKHGLPKDDSSQDR